MAQNSHFGKYSQVNRSNDNTSNQNRSSTNLDSYFSQTGQIQSVKGKVSSQTNLLTNKNNTNNNMSKSDIDEQVQSNIQSRINEKLQTEGSTASHSKENLLENLLKSFSIHQNDVDAGGTMSSIKNPSFYTQKQSMSILNETDSKHFKINQSQTTAQEPPISISGKPDNTTSGFYADKKTQKLKKREMTFQSKIMNILGGENIQFRKTINRHLMNSIDFDLVQSQLQLSVESAASAGAVQTKKIIKNLLPHVNAEDNQKTPMKNTFTTERKTQKTEGRDITIQLDAQKPSVNTQLKKLKAEDFSQSFFEQSLKKEIHNIDSDQPCGRLEAQQLYNWYETIKKSLIGCELSNSEMFKRWRFLIGITVREMMREIGLQCVQRGFIFNQICDQLFHYYQQSMEIISHQLQSVNKEEINHQKLVHQIYEEMIEELDRQNIELNREFEKSKSLVQLNQENIQSLQSDGKSLRNEIVRLKQIISQLTKKVKNVNDENTFIRNQKRDELVGLVEKGIIQMDNVDGNGNGYGGGQTQGQAPGPGPLKYGGESPSKSSINESFSKVQKLRRMESQSQRSIRVESPLRKMNTFQLNERTTTTGDEKSSYFKKLHTLENQNTNNHQNFFGFSGAGQRADSARQIKEMYHQPEKEEDETEINVFAEDDFINIERLNAVGFSDPEHFKQLTCTQEQTGNSLLIFAGEIDDQETQTDLHLLDPSYDVFIYDQQTVDRVVDIIDQYADIQNSLNQRAAERVIRKNEREKRRQLQEAERQLKNQEHLPTSSSSDSEDDQEEEEFQSESNINSQGGSFMFNEGDDPRQLSEKIKEGQKSIFDIPIQKQTDRRAAFKPVQAPKLGQRVQVENFEVPKEAINNLVKNLKEKKYAQFKNILPLPMILKQITLIYNSRIKMVNENPRNKQIEFSQFTYQYLTKMYGFQQIVDEKFIILILSLKQYHDIVRINNFMRFFGLLQPTSNNFNLDEQNQYIETLNYIMNVSNVGQTPNPIETEPKYYIPYIRAIAFYSNFADTRMTPEENSEIRKEIDALKQVDPQGLHTHGIIDFDNFMSRLLVQYRLLVSRAQSYVINAFAASDLDGNGYCNIDQFNTLMKHIEKDNTLTQEERTTIFCDYADAQVDEERNLTFGQFAVVCVDYNLFTQEAQNKFLGIQNQRDCDHQFNDLKFNWRVHYFELTRQFEGFQNIDNDDRDQWMDIIRVLDDKMTSNNTKQDPKPLLIAYEIVKRECDEIEVENMVIQTEIDHGQQQLEGGGVIQKFGTQRNTVILHSASMTNLALFENMKDDMTEESCQKLFHSEIQGATSIDLLKLLKNQINLEFKQIDQPANETLKTYLFKFFDDSQLQTISGYSGTFRQNTVLEIDQRILLLEQNQN